MIIGRIVNLDGTSEPAFLNDDCIRSIFAEMREKCMKDVGKTPEQANDMMYKIHNDNEEMPLNPEYYSRWKIQPIDFITQNELDFLRGNIIKYLMRYDVKNGVEDLKKARVYLDKLIEENTHA